MTIIQRPHANRVFVSAFSVPCPNHELIGLKDGKGRRRIGILAATDAPLKMDHYDPEIAPAPQEWLALDESERMLHVEDYHRDARIRLPQSARHLHATIHVIVENQLALDDQTVVRSTLNRLMEDGLTRHDAIHAIGSVLAECLYDLLHTEGAAPDPLEPYYAALQQLTAEKWRDG